MQKSLQDILEDALKNTWALPHFNISNLEQLRGVCEAARLLRAPLLIGTSEGERNFIGPHAAVALIHAYQDEYRIPIFLNADHTTSIKEAKRAIDAGYESIHIDLSKQPLRENMAGTKEVVVYAHTKNPKINIEGELGYLVTDSSKVYKKKIAVDPKTFTKPAEAEQFIEETGVHRFAPAVGNLHGIAANRPHLDFALIKKLRRTVPKSVALVLHGGSGNSAQTFRRVIDLGFNNIHISTELRLAYREGLERALKKSPDELAPYKLLSRAVSMVQERAEYYIKIFRANNRV